MKTKTITKIKEMIIQEKIYNSDSGRIEEIADKFPEEYTNDQEYVSFQKQISDLVMSTALNLFKKESYINNNLIQTVIDQIGGYNDFICSVADIVNYGINTGVIGFTWTSDTVQFFQDNKRDILDLIKETSEQIGIDALEMINSFQCIKKLKLSTWELSEIIFSDKKNDNSDMVKNCLTWFAGEEVARSFYDIFIEN